jgi:hypothetical protein
MNDFVLTHALPCIDKSKGKICVGLDSPGGCHLAGDTITGNIYIRTKIKPSELHAESLSLSLLGIEKY